MDITEEQLLSRGFTVSNHLYLYEGTTTEYIKPLMDKVYIEAEVTYNGKVDIYIINKNEGFNRIYLPPGRSLTQLDSLISAFLNPIETTT